MATMKKFFLRILGRVLMNSLHDSFTAHIRPPFYLDRCILLTGLSLHITTNPGPESWLIWQAAPMARLWWHTQKNFKVIFWFYFFVTTFFSHKILVYHNKNKFFSNLLSLKCLNKFIVNFCRQSFWSKFSCLTCLVTKQCFLIFLFTNNFF